MFTFSTCKKSLGALAFLFLALTITATGVLAGDFNPNAVNPYSNTDMEDDGEALLDAVDRDHPLATNRATGAMQGTVYDPRIPGNVDDDSSRLIDVVDKLYPPDTSATIDDPRYQDLNSETMSTDEEIDTIDRLNAGQPVTRY
jgi:hypothetical protein